LVLGELGPRGEQVLAGLGHPRGHARFGRLAVRARVVRLLVADVAVHLEYAVVVAEHMTRDRAGERVLRVGVDVHLHHTVGERLADLAPRGPRPAVEDQVERLLRAVLGPDCVLDLLEYAGPELHVTRLVYAVHVAERRGEDVPAMLADAE